MLTFNRITGAVIASLVAACFILANVDQAHADEGNTHTTVVAQYGDTSTVVTRHDVVVTSTLRHCPLEDGSGHPGVRKLGPCTWNVGPGVDGNGRGLAYVLSYSTSTHRLVGTYVWNHNPAVNGWHWVRNAGPGTADCVVKAGVNRARCSDGNYIH